MPDDALRIRLLIVTEMLDQAVRELRKVAGEIRTAAPQPDDAAHTDTQEN